MGRIIGLSLVIVLAVAALGVIATASRREPPARSAVDSPYLKMDCRSLRLRYYEEQYAALNAANAKAAVAAVTSQGEISRAMEQKACPSP